MQIIDLWVGWLARKCLGRSTDVMGHIRECGHHKILSV